MFVCVVYQVHLEVLSYTRHRGAREADVICTRSTILTIEIEGRICGAWEWPCCDVLFPRVKRRDASSLQPRR